MQRLIDHDAPATSRESKMRNELAATANGMITIFGLLVEDLDARGAISKADFSEKLRTLADMLRTEGASADPNRLDALVIERVGAWLSGDRQGWTPVVIPGGKD